MSKLTVLVKSCQRDKKLGFHDAIRFTWGKDLTALGVNVKFMMGGPGYDRVSDEINLVDCPDSYMDLPEKTRQICNWAVLNPVGTIFLCDIDTLVRAERLTLLPWEQYDYAGGFKGGQAEVGKQFNYRDIHLGQETTLWPWASGGYGYFLSSRAQAAVAATFPMVWAEDMYVGQVIGPTDLKIAAFPMTKITIHLPKQDWSPEVIKKTYHELK